MKRSEPSVNDAPSPEEVCALLQKHRFLLVSGKAGTGKSKLLRDLRVHLENELDEKVVVAAPTGIAAVNIGGLTLHSWLGMGLLDEPLQDIMKRKLSRRTKRALKGRDVLLIDEISMVEAKFFEAMVRLASKVCGTDEPFGRKRVVMFGDFCQLPPVKGDAMVFETKAFRDMNVHRIFLRKVYRQSDPVFLGILNEVRLGNLSRTSSAILADRCVVPKGPHTRLCSYRNIAQKFNRTELAKVPGEAVVVEGKYCVVAKEGVAQVCEHELKRSKKRISHMLRSFPVESRVELKVGAQVMMRCNALIHHGVCNGSMGTVEKIIGDGERVIVQFENGANMCVKKHRFYCPMGPTTRACLQQIPLCLSYALTIHKSQGMSLDRVLIDTNCFESGQMYTALSRVRTLEGLHLISLNRKGLKAHPRAVRFESSQTPKKLKT